jgi:hypothetical protein
MTHPFVWGIEAYDLLHPDLEMLIPLLRHSVSPSSFEGRVDDPNHHKPEKRSILDNEISMIVALEWDDSISSNWRRWSHRFKKPQHVERSLSFSTEIVIAKPHHPILLDTISSIAEILSVPRSLGGIFTDAIIRYLLVQYGITLEDLRDLWEPVRIGDIM